ncbi:MAG TPA: hypothetical protein VNZ50_11065 [Hyphomicrobiaceae bacterium]|jgi:hypothetical protein|nr:hypothetical protein [Hyphomicrobiaceae bacterium]
MPLIRFFSASLELFLEILAGLFTRLVAIGIVAVILFYLLELWIGNVPPLIAGLPSTLLRPPHPNPVQVLNERVQAAFRSGMPEADVERELTRQGFEIAVSATTGRVFRWARYYTTDPICRTSWGIGWRADETGKIVEVRGSRHEACL